MILLIFTYSILFLNYFFYFHPNFSIIFYLITYSLSLFTPHLRYLKIFKKKVSGILKEGNDIYLSYPPHTLFLTYSIVYTRYYSIVYSWYSLSILSSIHAILYLKYPLHIPPPPTPPIAHTYSSYPPHIIILLFSIFILFSLLLFLSFRSFYFSLSFKGINEWKFWYFLLQLDPPSIHLL